MARSVKYFCSPLFFVGWHLLLQIQFTGAFSKEVVGPPYHEKISINLFAKFNKDKNTRWAETRVEVIVELRGLSGEMNQRSVFNANPGIRQLLRKIQEKAQTPKENRSPEMTRLAHEIQVKMTENLNPVLELLSKLRVSYESLWATGEVYIPEATWSLIEKIVGIEEVTGVRTPGVFNVAPPEPPEDVFTAVGKINTTWTLTQIDARCSEIFCLGDGVTVGFIDTGVRTTHKEISQNWIGMPYGFYDSAHPTVNCTPRDEGGHGTHVVGTAVGANVGVAPTAKWMMCMGCTYKNCSEAAVKICGQYLFCPWECGDASVTKITKDCSRRPDVISNSWGMTTRERLVMPDDFFYPLLELWNAVGIISVFGAGNAGPTCGSGIPPGTYDIAIGVGAVDINTTLPHFSSVGPQLSKRPLTNMTTSTGTCKKATCSKRPSKQMLCSLIKPDLVAPGVRVNSSFHLNDTSYELLSGTSMATPHVAGVVALMMCANPHLRWNYKLAYNLLTRTTDTSKIEMQPPKSRYGRFTEDTNLMCNVVLHDICDSYPNNMFGHGLVNACEAVKAARLEILNGDNLLDHFNVS